MNMLYERCVGEEHSHCPAGSDYPPPFSSGCNIAFGGRDVERRARLPIEGPPSLAGRVEIGKCPLFSLRGTRYLWRCLPFCFSGMDSRLSTPLPVFQCFLCFFVFVKAKTLGFRLFSVFNHLKTEFLPNDIKNPVRTSQETHYVSTTKLNRLMLFGETVAVYCDNHTEHTDTLCGRNAEFVPHRKHVTSPLQSSTG
jgi:hypothetical protein